MTSASYSENAAVLAPRRDWLLGAAQFISRPANTTYVLLCIAGLLFAPCEAMDGAARWHLMIVAALCNFGLVQGIKQICWAPRPHSRAFPAPLRWGKGYRSGFPSGHTVPAFLLACLVTKLHPFYGAACFVCAILIAWSRVQVRAHFAWQVILSALMGLALGAALCLL
jgi:membrane-associated phospholipid phosphatase